MGAVLTAKASWTDVGGFTNTLASAPTAAVTPDVPAAPSNLLAAPGDMTVVLSWGEPASTIARHDYRFKTDGSYPVGWTPITDSAPGGANATGITVPSLTNGLAYTFQVRAVDMDGVEGEPAESATVTPAGGICARTLQVQTAILAAISGVDDCAAVTATHLSAIWGLRPELAPGSGRCSRMTLPACRRWTWLQLRSKRPCGASPRRVLRALVAGTSSMFGSNDLAALPPGVFSGLSSIELSSIWASNDLATLRADVLSRLFSGLSSLEIITSGRQRHPCGASRGRALQALLRALESLESIALSLTTASTALPEDVFSGLSNRWTALYLHQQQLRRSFPRACSAGLSSLTVLWLFGGTSLNELPPGVFAGLSSLTDAPNCRGTTAPCR